MKVLLTDNLAPEAVAVFESYPDIEAVVCHTLPANELCAAVADCHAMIVRSPTKVTAEVMAAAKALRFIGRAGVGVDNIDVDEATRRGIVVMNSPGGNTISTAEHTIAVMLAVARHVPQAHASLRAGAWDRKRYRGAELFEKTLGVVGLGRVGREVARRMRAFGMTVIGSDPYVDAGAAGEAGAQKVSFEEVLERSDWITVHVPLGADTRGLIGDDEIARMKKGVVLINCARGGVVDEAALDAALESGHVAAAGLDVFADEPPGDHPLLRHEQCVFTPHLGAATGEAQLRVAVEVAKAVAEALSGREIRNAVNRPGA